MLFETPGTVLEDNELPKEIDIGGVRVTIVRFTDNGFVVDDHRAKISGKATLLEAEAETGSSH